MSEKLATSKVVEKVRWCLPAVAGPPRRLTGAPNHPIVGMDDDGGKMIAAEPEDASPAAARSAARWKSPTKLWSRKRRRDVTGLDPELSAKLVASPLTKIFEFLQTSFVADDLLVAFKRYVGHLSSGRAGRLVWSA